MALQLIPRQPLRILFAHIPQLHRALHHTCGSFWCSAIPRYTVGQGFGGLLHGVHGSKVPAFNPDAVVGESDFYLVEGSSITTEAMFGGLLV